jgi:exonuclease III
VNKYIQKYQNFKLKIGIDNYISSKIILSMIIYLLLLQYGISPNPGPENSKKSNVSFDTYNCRGLMDGRKLRRVLAKVGQLVDKNCIVALQETHKIGDRLLELYWKHNFIRNCNHSNKKGVVLLFNNEFRVNKFETDKDERYIIAELENSFLNLIVGNVNFPNDHTEAMSFSDKFYTKLLEFQYVFPEAYTIILGDFNCCMEKNDSLNRIRTQQELDLVKTLKANM